MDTHALAQHPPSTSRTGRTRARPGPSALAQCFLCSAWAVLLGYGPYSGTSILLKVRPPTGEPDAGDPPVRFGGRGNRDHSVPPTPIKRGFCTDSSTSRDAMPVTTPPSPDWQKQLRM